MRAAHFPGYFALVSFLGVLGVLALSFGTDAAWAVSGELRELYRGSRAQAMGNAFTAVADDEQALFLNPAGLAGITKTKFNYAALDLEVSGDVVTAPSSFSTLTSSSSTDVFNALMGQNIYARAQVTPTLVMPNFGVGIILDQQVALMAKNRALPSVTVGYQTTEGVQFGTGFSVGRKSRAETNTDVRIGFGGKILWRRGGYRELSVSQMLAFSGQDGQAALQSLAGEYGMGYGIDFGLQVIRNFNHKFSASFGAAMTEIGNVTFSSSADPQKGNLSTGVAFRYRLPGATVGLSYDYRHILDETDWEMRSHLGTFVELPLISIYAGLNQMNPTYGAAFDAWIFRVTALSYSEELGLVSGQESERRYLVRLALNFGL